MRSLASRATEEALWCVGRALVITLWVVEGVRQAASMGRSRV